MALQAERQAMASEAHEVAVKEFMDKHTRNCPGCDTIGFIPSDDYLCEECRMGD
jgi:hypothetical protein